MKLCGLQCLFAGPGSPGSPGSPVVPVPLCAANKVCTAAASLFFNHLASVKAELNAVMTVRAGCSLALFSSTL